MNDESLEVKRALYATTVDTLDQQAREYVLQATSDKDKSYLEMLAATDVTVPEEIQATASEEKLQWLKTQAGDSLVYAEGLLSDPDDIATWRELTGDLLVWYGKGLLVLDLMVPGDPVSDSTR
ncbi:MAG: hypothetical protein JWS12_361 [Candidatus Saccharibacteria bacterium]|nr:hypothetical protein [Candidatus Saccharibacteria bacterium]